MRDISAKQITLRTANAIGFLKCSEPTFQLIKENKIPKGNIYDYAKASAFLGAKQTQNIIPHCHPVSIDGLQVDFTLVTPGENIHEIEFTEFGVLIDIEAKSIGRTGIEMEALASASTAALTLYDMLKYTSDTELEIKHVKLLKKVGGKSDRHKYVSGSEKINLIIASTAIIEGKKENKLTSILEEKLADFGLTISFSEVFKNNSEALESAIIKSSENADLTLVAGGSGLADGDDSYDLIKTIIDNEVEGIKHAAFSHGFLRSSNPMVSRIVAGTKNRKLIVGLPGSSAGLKESLDAVFPGVFKVLRQLEH